MSAGRKYRRQADRWLWRKPGTELAAETRAWVARMKEAHDDPAVTVEEFMEVARAWSAYMADRPHVEQVEAALQIHEHATRQLTGRPSLHAVAVEKKRPREWTA